MSANDKRPPKGPRIFELPPKPPPVDIYLPHPNDPQRRNPVKLAFKPITGKSLTQGPSLSAFSPAGRVISNGSAPGFGLILSNSAARQQPSATVEKAFELDAPSSSRATDDHISPSRTREASDAYPTPNTPPQTVGTSSPARTVSADDDPRDREPAPPPPSEPPPPVPTPPPFGDDSAPNAPPSPPPTDRQPSPAMDDLVITEEVEPEIPRGPTPPPPFESTQIRAWKTVHDPKIEGLSSKEKGKSLERRQNGEVPEGQPPIVVHDPRAKMSDEQKYGMKGRRPLRPKLYSFNPYEWDTNSPGPRPLGPPRAILITNLSHVTPTAFVKRFFAQFGRIEDFDWEVDLHTGNPLGICWVRFEGDDYVEGPGQKSALKAIEKANGERVGQGQEGQIVKIVLDGQKKRCKAVVKAESDRRRAERVRAKAKDRELLPPPVLGRPGTYTPSYASGGPTPSSHTPVLATGGSTSHSLPPRPSLPTSLRGTEIAQRVTQPLNPAPPPIHPSLPLRPNVITRATPPPPDPHNTSRITPLNRPLDPKIPTVAKPTWRDLSPEASNRRVPIRKSWRDHSPEEAYPAYRQRAPRRGDTFGTASSYPHSRHHYRPLPSPQQHRHHHRHRSRSASSDSPYHYDRSRSRSRSSSRSRYSRSRSRSRSDSRSRSHSRTPSPHHRHHRRQAAYSPSSSHDRRDGRKQTHDGPDTWRPEDEDNAHADIELQLAENGKEHILISKASLQRTARIGEEDVRDFFIKNSFPPDKIMYDSAGWYITFGSSSAARRASVVLDKQKLSHHTISLTVRPAPSLEYAKASAISRRDPTSPVSRKTGTKLDISAQAHTMIVDDDLREVIAKSLAGVDQTPVDATTASTKLANLRFKKKPGTVRARAVQKRVVVVEEEPVRDSPVPEVDDALRDDSPMPSPPKKRRKVKQEIAPDVESEDEEPLTAIADDDDTAEQAAPEKRHRAESPVPELPVSRKKRKVDSTPAPTATFDADLDAEVDAMLMEHLDTAPERKPKGVGRKKKKQPLVSKADSVEPDVILPEVQDLEPAVDIPMLDGDVLDEAPPVEEVPKPAPKKRGGRQPKVKTTPAPPGPPPDPFSLSLVDAEDDEDLYLLQEGLRRRKAGLPEWGVDLREPDDDDDAPKRHPAIRVNATGSARTEGYYKIPEAAKALYLPDRNKAKIDFSSGGSSSQPAPVGASSRSTRVESRHLARGVEQANRLLTQLGGADSSTDLKIKFNQLRTRKKKLRFARSPIHDWGLYAMEPISVGEMVIEYVGELIRQQVADKREKYYERTGIGSSYLFRVDDDAVVDATKKGNLGRLINHCCAPNCTAKIITINGEKKIVIYAKSNIEPGDEITYDYHFPIEQEKIICLCGSSKCRGFLN